MSVVQPPPAAASPTVGDEIRPAVVWYWIGGAIAVIGILGAVVWGVARYQGMVDEIDGFARVSVPGEREVFLDEGTYQIYVESDAGVFGTVPEVRIQDPSGSGVPLLRSGTSETYDFGGRHGESVYEFTAAHSGEYRVEVAGAPLGGADRIAIGDSILGELLVLIFGGLGIAALAVLVSGTVVIVTAVRRSSARRRSRQAAGWAPPGGYPPPPAGYPSPPASYPPPPAGYPSPPASYPPPPAGYPSPPASYPPPPPPPG